MGMRCGRDPRVWEGRALFAPGGRLPRRPWPPSGSAKATARVGAALRAAAAAAASPHSPRVVRRAPSLELLSEGRDIVRARVDHARNGEAWRSKTPVFDCKAPEFGWIPHVFGGKAPVFDFAAPAFGWTAPVFGGKEPVVDWRHFQPAAEPSRLPIADARCETSALSRHLQHSKISCCTCSVVKFRVV